MRAVPGLFVAFEDGDSATWEDMKPREVKRRHFVVEGQTLKLFGRRGKTYKGRIDLLAVTELKPPSDQTAPAGAFELHVRASRAARGQTCILAPDHSADALFFGLCNAVPSHVTSEELWRRHYSSRSAVPEEHNPREYRLGRTLGTGTFGKVRKCSAPAFTVPRYVLSSTHSLAMCMFADKPRMSYACMRRDQVKLAERADGELFAIKCLNRNRLEHASQSGRLAKEIRLLKMLNHPNVIRLHEVLHTPSEMLMVMEYVDGGDLLEVLNTSPRFGEADVRHIFCQICAGVSFCHSLGVAHRDLKVSVYLRLEPPSPLPVRRPLLHLTHAKITAPSLCSPKIF
jgi:hypothetical protein